MLIKFIILGWQLQRYSERCDVCTSAVSSLFQKVQHLKGFWSASPLTGSDATDWRAEDLAAPIWTPYL